MLTLDQLIKPKVEKVTTSDGEVGLRVLTLAEITLWGKQAKEHPLESRTKMIAMSLCNDDGVRLFPDEKTEAATGIRFVVAIEIFDHCLRINKLAKEKPISDQKAELAESVKIEGATQTGS